MSSKSAEQARYSVPSRPVIGRYFAIDDAAQAYAHLEAARHFRKVVIEIRR